MKYLFVLTRLLLFRGRSSQAQVLRDKNSIAHNIIESQLQLRHLACECQVTSDRNQKQIKFQRSLAGLPVVAKIILISAISIKFER